MNGPVVIGIDGLQLTGVDRERLRHPLVGMVILFARNFESPEQLGRLTAEIHAIRTPPLLIAVDHEGGRVQRFRDGFTRLPPMRRLGELWDRDVMASCRAAASVGYVLAAELRAHGVDLSFTPVLDIDWGRSGVIGDRAFHSDPRVVAMLASHLCHGMALAGMASCGKHFPGHGWAEADSHVAIPHDERSRAILMASDVAPYRWLGPRLAGVMPAHVVYDQIDSEPAGFSAKWLRLLRSELGFTGAIFSDDLLMEGASDKGPVVQRAKAGLAAGCDLVLVCSDSKAIDATLDGLRWKPSRRFAQRVERLAPRGVAISMRELGRNEMYRVAQADCGPLLG